jgi:hypothetical protein
MGGQSGLSLFLRPEIDVKLYFGFEVRVYLFASD